jgi:hypothetical protein
MLPEREFSGVFAQADQLLREGKADEAVGLADRVLLIDRLGLDKSARAALVGARRLLLDRRTERSARSQ